MAAKRALRLRLGLSGCVVGIAALAALIPGLFTHANPLQMGASSLAPPSLYHPLGTDQFGRDLLARLIYGARPSLTVAGGSVLWGGAIGTLLGVAGAYWGGFPELLTMRVSDVVLCFPPIVVAMLVVGFLGAGVANLILIIGLLLVPQFARVAYAQALAVREMEFVEAAVVVGVPWHRIMLRAILPNVAGPLIVQASLSAAAAMLLESGLSFLGLGVLPPSPSWGLMIGTATRYMAQDPAFVLWPSLALALAILAINALGDALQTYLNPRLRR